MMLMIPVKMEADKKLGEQEVTVGGEVAAARKTLASGALLFWSIDLKPEEGAQGAHVRWPYCGMF